ncbi:MAG: cardiolipin synthase [Acidobacteriota bacterium]
MKRSRKVLFISVYLIAVCIFCGCATLPNVSEIIEDAPAGERSPEIVSAKGALPEQTSKKIIKRIKRFSGVSDIIEKQTLALEDVSGRPLVAGNKVTLLIDGPATYDAMLKAIREAKKNINLETFVFEDDEVGQLFAEEFLKKQAEGVQVNIIYDSVGSKNTSITFFQLLRDSGINVLEFNPVNPLRAFVGKWHLAQRDHRKILVVDGSIAFTGGVNISHVYSSSLSGITGEHEKEELKTGEPGGPWRDTHVQIEGPAVAELQKLFLETWKDKKGSKLLEEDYFPQLHRKGSDLVQVIGSTPGELNRVTFIMYVAAFVNAERSIHITTPYFVPDGQAVSSLIDAASRGLDVKIVLPEVSDSSLALYAGHYQYSNLLKAGVKLYERQHAMIHAKTSVVDGVWSTVGSTNMDLWSFLHNNEVNAIIIGSDFANEMEVLFERDLQQSKEVVLEDWRRRPLLPRIMEWFANLFRRYL